MVKTVLRALKIVIPVLVSAGVVSSCKKDKDKGCADGLDYTKCVTCTVTETFQGQSQSYNYVYCPASYTVPEMQQYVAELCAYDGQTYAGKKYNVDCHN